MNADSQACQKDRVGIEKFCHLAALKRQEPQACFLLSERVSFCQVLSSAATFLHYKPFRLLTMHNKL